MLLGLTTFNQAQSASEIIIKKSKTGGSPSKAVCFIF